MLQEGDSAFTFGATCSSPTDGFKFSLHNHSPGVSFSESSVGCSSEAPADFR